MPNSTRLHSRWRTWLASCASIPSPSCARSSRLRSTVSGRSASCRHTASASSGSTSCASPLSSLGRRALPRQV
eukprot:782675-Alexandrium_andersonii.AAC.1